ncbi:MAG: hypothetical protein ACK4TA_08725 [Saprospiraceae bacterium]
MNIVVMLLWLGATILSDDFNTQSQTTKVNNGVIVVDIIGA